MSSRPWSEIRAEAIASGQITEAGIAAAREKAEAALAAYAEVASEPRARAAPPLDPPDPESWIERLHRRAAEERPVKMTTRVVLVDKDGNETPLERPAADPQPSQLERVLALQDELIERWGPALDRLRDA